MRVWWAITAVVLMVGLITACQSRAGRDRERQPTVPVAAPELPAARPSVPQIPQPRVLPPLQGEPQLDVLLKRSERAFITLHTTAQVDGQALRPGRYLVEARPQGVVIAAAGLVHDQALFFDMVNQPHSPAFSLDPGEGQQEYGGDLVIKMVDGRLALCERLGLEDFLPGVLVREMGASWPLEALKAQAVAARSYLTSQYLRHHQRPWQVAAAERVDVAYAGQIRNPHINLATALRQTRGDLLMYGGLPVLAWFHSCSGGRTAGKNEAFPGAMAADGVTDPAPAMPSVDDPWAQRGAEGLRRPTVYRWHYQITGDALSWRIRQQAQAEGKTLALGTITAIRVLSHHPSGRADELEVRHSGSEGGGTWQVSAPQFRLWAGSHHIRSTWWEALRRRGNEFHWQGRGFGHGVGMSQISAWAMAQEGLLASQILRHFYLGASLVRRW